MNVVLTDFKLEQMLLVNLQSSIVYIFQIRSEVVELCKYYTASVYSCLDSCFRDVLCMSKWEFFFFWPYLNAWHFLYEMHMKCQRMEWLVSQLEILKVKLSCIPQRGGFVSWLQCLNTLLLDEKLSQLSEVWIWPNWYMSVLWCTIIIP